MAIEVDKVNFLQIGVEGENDATKIQFDMSAWENELRGENPDLGYGVIFKPYNSAYKYPMVVTFDSETNILTWKISSAATQTPGVGYTEVRAQDSTTGLIKKTRVIPTSLENSVSGVDADPPEVQEDFVTEVVANGLKAEGYAVGKQNGEDVDSSSIYYHNNVKYYYDHVYDNLIDDTAGSGATTRTWSANKLNSQFNAKADKTGTELSTTLSRGRKSNTTVGTGSFAFGNSVTASGNYSHAEGSSTKAEGAKSHAEGSSTTASGENSHAEGSSTSATGIAAHAEGILNTASENGSHAEGNSTQATAGSAHAEGFYTVASGADAHAEGANTTASGTSSHAEGSGTVANHLAQHVFGKHNVSDPSTASAASRGNYVEIVGNGSSASNRSNARALDWNGNEYLKGDLYVGCGTSSTGGTKVATTTAVSAKADKVSDATSGNFAGLDSNGNLTDSGHKHSDYLTSHQDISGKADKVNSATNGNFAGLDSNGNLTDSGHKHSDYLTSHQDISGKADKVASATNGNFAALDSNGNLTDSGHKHSDYITDISGKLDKPSVAGAEGQVLTSDGEGGQAWVNPAGGAQIDDTAGSGATTKAWSADKLTTEFGKKADKVSSATNGNFAGLDSNGNLTDSGHKHSDYLTSHQDISGKANKNNTVLTSYLSRGRKSNTTTGTASFAFGNNVEASGTYSHAEGSSTKASSSYAHAEGSSTTASSSAAHAEGGNTTASGSYSHAEGIYTTASQEATHAEGYGTTASGHSAHAEGYGTTASGHYSHSEGNYTKANHKAQHVFGEYNVEDASTAATTARGNYVEVVGNGTGTGAKSNARALDWSGNEYLNGDLYFNCNDDSSGGTSVSALAAAGVVESFTIEASDWAQTSPYTYTWTNAHVTANCRVEVDFADGVTAEMPYIEYEKVSGGIQFTAPSLPTDDIPVIVTIDNVQQSAVTSVSGDMVSTDVITGASNVDEALDSINSKLEPVELLSLASADYTTNPLSVTLSDSYLNYKYLIFRCSAGSDGGRSAYIFPVSDIVETTRPVILDRHGLDSFTEGNPTVSATQYFTQCVVVFTGSTSATIRRITSNANYVLSINRIYGFLKA